MLDRSGPLAPASSSGNPADSAPSDVRLDVRVVVAPGPATSGRLASHREFYLKPPHSLVPPDGVISHRPELGSLSYRGQLGLILEPTDRHTPPDRILERVAFVVLAAEVVSIERLAVGWEGTMWHVRYGEGGAFDGSCPVGAVAAPIRTAADLQGLRLVDDWGATDVEVGQVAEFLAYVNRWLALGPGVLVLAGAGHGPRLELDGADPVVVFDAAEPRVGPGGHVRVDGGALGRIDVSVIAAAGA